MKPAPRQPPAPRPRTLRNFFATCTLGLEEVIAAELRAIGAEGVSVTRGGAAFLGDLVLGWRANLELRSATRVQELIAEFRVADDRALYDGIRRLDWSKYMSVEQTLAVDATVRDSALRHSGFVALKVKDAIVDQFREQTKRRPSVDTDDPHLPLNVMLKKGIASVYRNFSGASLHKRGYREAQVKSPLNEATAAGLLLLSGWDWKSGIVDPMCGSATFLIEAAWIALGRRDCFASSRSNAGPTSIARRSNA
jgi:putative N6-adenine-specific DNA methylase